MSGLLWRLFPAIRIGERPRFLFFAVLAGLLSLAQTLGLAGTEALLLTHLGVERLPVALVTASGVAVVGALAYSIVVSRARNDRLLIAICCGASLTWLALLPFTGPARPFLWIALFCGYFAAQAVLFTHFRTFATDYVDTVASKRLFPGFAVGASLGGATGGALAVALSRLALTESLIVGWSLALLAAAFWVERGRASLRSWGPLGLEEADESSAEGMEGALRFMRRSPLARWLVVSMVGMVFALTWLHFLSAQIFVERFPEPAELATFLGTFLAVSNGLEIAVALWITPWLLGRYGVAQANLLHPALAMMAFGGLFLAPGLGTALNARANRELIENALAGEVRNLSYNAIPFRFRGSLRALLEGLVMTAALSIAGAALMLLGPDVGLGLACLIGLAAAALYAAANIRVRGAYLRSLLSELQRGRLELAELASQLSNAEVERLAEQWEETLPREGERPSRAVLDLIPILAARGHGARLRAVFRSDASRRLRAACLEALAEHRDPECASLLSSALAEESPELRRLGARLAAAGPPQDENLRAALRSRLGDPDRVLRARAARALGDEGRPILLEMIQCEDLEDVVAALSEPASGLQAAAAHRLDDEQPAVRAAAMRFLQQEGDESALTLARLDSELSHADSRVRLASVEALAGRDQRECAVLAARALDDQARDVRSAASTTLASLGGIGWPHAYQSASGPRRWTVDAALSVLAASDSPTARRFVEQVFEHRVALAWRWSIAREHCPSDDGVAGRFLRAAVDNAFDRDQWLAFRSLEILESPKVVRSVRTALRYETSRTRADALEVLSNLGPRGSAQLFSLLLEDGPVTDKLPNLGGLVQAPTSVDELLHEAQRSDDHWLELAALQVLQAPSLDAPQSSESETQVMEHLLALRNVALFRHLTLDQLDSIRRSMGEAEHVAGDVIMREGDPGDMLYVLIEGAVDVFRGYQTDSELLLNQMTPVSYIGEIAILDSSPRSATIVATEDSRLLTLDGDRFRELVLQSPEISFEIFPVLTERIRAAEANR